MTAGAEVVIRRIATIDGQNVPLSECDWLYVAPCGCACGISVAEMHGHVVADEEAAMLTFTTTETKREVERDRAAGFTVRLIRHSEFQQNKDILTIKCPHDPPWGVEKVVIPDGFAWAAEGRAKTKHLVPERAIYRGDWRAYAEVPHAERRALCRAGSKFVSWSAEDYRLDMTLECARCEAAARKAAGGVA